MRLRRPHPQVHGKERSDVRLERSAGEHTEGQEAVGFNLPGSGSRRPARGRCPGSRDSVGRRGYTPTCSRTGYRLVEFKREGDRRVLGIAILGRTGATDPVRQAERDAVTRQAYTALTEAELDVRLTDDGHLTVWNPGALVLSFGPLRGLATPRS